MKSLLFLLMLAANSSTAKLHFKSLTGYLQPKENNLHHLFVYKGKNTIDIIVENDDQVISCQFIDVDLGNVVVLQQDNVRQCHGITTVSSTKKMDVKVINACDTFVEYHLSMINEL